MKTIKNKQLLVGADFAGYPLKEAVCEHLRAKGWEITDIGVRADSDPDDTELMFHRVGLRVGSMIAEREFERALIFCGTGMGIHIAASKCPHVHAGVVESVPAAHKLEQKLNRQAACGQHQHLIAQVLQIQTMCLRWTVRKLQIHGYGDIYTSNIYRLL